MQVPDVRLSDNACRNSNSPSMAEICWGANYGEFAKYIYVPIKDFFLLK